MSDEALALLGELGAAEAAADLLCRLAYGAIRAGGSLAAAYLDYERAAELARTAGTAETVAGRAAGSVRSRGCVATCPAPGVSSSWRWKETPPRRRAPGGRGHGL